MGRTRAAVAHAELRRLKRRPPATVGAGAVVTGGAGALVLVTGVGGALGPAGGAGTRTATGGGGEGEAGTVTVGGGGGGFAAFCSSLRSESLRRWH